jgi:hypothetical protein
VAAIMAALGVSGGWQIVRHAHADLQLSSLSPASAVH